MVFQFVPGLGAPNSLVSNFLLHYLLVVVSPLDWKLLEGSDPYALSHFPRQQPSVSTATVSHSPVLSLVFVEAVLATVMAGTIVIMNIKLSHSHFILIAAVFHFVAALVYFPGHLKLDI